MNGNIHKCHRQRIRNRFEHESLDGFEPHEVLELLLQYAIKRKDVNPIAHALLDHFGSLSATMEASKEELMRVEGVGESAASFLRMIPQFGRRYGLDKLHNGRVFESLDSIGAYCVNRYVGETDEVLSLMLLDESFRMLGWETVQRGSLSCSTVNLEKLAEVVFRYDAPAFILVHNHPNGTIFPSVSDLDTTYRIREIMGNFNRVMLEHIIVANNRYFPIVRYLERQEDDAETREFFDSFL